jgi:NAD(P)-dependent dehydrogenase (short-subunit alcohol dehydrogenase family)
MIVGMSRPLEGKVAVVAGASRGAGRGIAISLGDAGATVYCAGRTRRGGAKPVDGAPGTVDDTAEEVNARGGRGIAVGADLTVEEQVARLFEGIERVDVLANAVWGGNERYNPDDWGKPFWEEPLETLRQTMLPGPWAYLLASRHAAPKMVAQGSGLIVNLTDGVLGDGTRPCFGNLAWDLPHVLTERLAVAMSHDLAPHGVAVIALMPGFMRTERVLMHLPTEEAKNAADFHKTETVEYLGRAVAALAADPKAIEKSGRLHWVADLAREYGVTDVDGRQPPRFMP